MKLSSGKVEQAHRPNTHQEGNGLCDHIFLEDQKAIGHQPYDSDHRVMVAYEASLIVEHLCIKINLYEFGTYFY